MSASTRLKSDGRKSIGRKPDGFDASVPDREYAEALIRRIVRECPRRRSASRQEHRAQVILRAQLAQQGGIAAWRRFRFNPNLYCVLGLHFAIAAAAIILFFFYPLVAAAIHLLIAVLYFLDSNRHGYVLRRLFPWRRASNLLVTFPAREKMRRRIVVTGHADAAPTGWIFSPRLARLGGGKRTPTWLRQFTKPLFLATVALVAVAAIEVDAWWVGAAFPRFPIAFVGSGFAFALIAVLNAQMLWRNEIVPGANDNLSGCVALPILARRLAGELPDDVELVFVVTACEEAGTGGAWALAHQMKGKWDPQKTDIVVLDSIAGGLLCLHQEGEILPWRIPPRLLHAAQATAAADSRFDDLKVFPLPAGATDALPFLACGFSAMSIGQIDLDTGTPENYHLPSDTPDRLNYERMMDTIAFTELLIRRLSTTPSRS